MWDSSELDVADTLLQLPSLVRDFSPGLPDVLHWATTKPRSVPAADSPPTKRVNKASGAITSSPTNPFSFDPSRDDAEVGGGGVAVESRRQRQARPAAAAAAAAAATKNNAKQHNEWVREQNRTIASLSASIVNLERALAEAKGRQQRLKTKNAWLHEMHSKVLLNMPELPQKKQPCNAHVGPTLFPAQPQPVAPMGAIFTPLVMTNHRIPGMVENLRVVPDLNAKAEEYEDAVMRMEIAAATAQARKRRMEINKERAQRGKRLQC